MATRTWIGGQDWNDPAGWGGTVPGPQDVAVDHDGFIPVAGRSGPVQSVRVEPVLERDFPVVSITGELDITGELYNRSIVEVYGTLKAGSLDGGSLIIGDRNVPTRSELVDVTSTTNAGVVTLNGGTTGQAALDLHQPLPSIGAFALTGNALVEVTNKIKTLTANIELEGPAARIAVPADLSTNSALTDLSQIAPSQSNGLYLLNGASLAVSGDLLAQGFLEVVTTITTNPPTTKLTVPGLLTNNYVFVVSGPAFIKAAGFTNNFEAAFLSTSAGSVAFGSVVNNGLITLFGSTTSLNADSFSQTTKGVSTLEISNARNSSEPTVAVTGNTALRGTLNIDEDVFAGRSFTVATFAPGHLSGIFDRIGDGQGNFGSGTVETSLDGKVKSGLIYDDAAGAVRFVTVAAPSTTIDTFRGTSGSWTTPASWSAGAPTFYTDAVIGNATVSLAADATVNSVALNAGARLSTAVGTDFSIGATLSLAAGAALAVGGQITVDSAVKDNGTVSVGSNGRADIRGNADGSGTFTIGAGGTLIFRALETNTVTFAGAGATLEIDRSYDFKGTLANLVAGDALDLAGAKVASASDDGRTLTVHKADTSSATFTLSNKQAGTGFAVQDDGAGGSRLVLQAAIRSASLPRFSGALPLSPAAPAMRSPGSSDTALAAQSGHDLFLPKTSSALT